MNMNKLLIIGITLTIFLMLNVVNAVEYNSESNLTIDDSISKCIVDVDGEINDGCVVEKIEYDENNIGDQYSSWHNPICSEKSSENNIQLSENSFEDVQIAINSSNEGEVIQLPECIFGQGSMNIINKSLEIRGMDNGTEVYSNSSNFVFYVTSNINSTIVFKNLKFYSLNDIYAEGAEITLINCSFVNSNNALYSFNTHATLIDCNFTNCFSNYGLIKCYNGECIFDNCVFQNCSAESYAIISTQKCNVYISKSIFRNNTQIYLSRSHSELSIADSVFDGNNGYNLISNEGNSYFYNSSFMNNGENIIDVSCCYDEEWDGDYVNCTVSNCSFYENNEWSTSLDILHVNASINSCKFLNTHGFAINFWQESFVQINNSLFENYTESIIYGFGSVLINNSCVMNNSVEERDALIWCRGYDDVVNITVENSYFCNNKNLLIKTEGNADLINSNFTNNFNLANINGNATVSYCNFIDNNLCDVLIEVSSNVYFTDSNFTNNFIRGVMIAFDYRENESMISRCTFKNNHGVEGIIMTGNPSVQDCIFLQNDLESISNAKSILNSVFINNTKRIIGGANLIDNCSFINNNIDYYGLIRNNLNNICIISNSKFIKNSIKKSIDTGVDMGDLIDLWSCDFTLDDCIFSNNSGKNYLINSNSGKVNISNCNFGDWNNCVLSVSYGDAIIGNCQFNKNNGGIFAFNSNLYTYNSNFTNNFYSADVGSGGAIYTSLNANLTVINCNFAGNAANSDGGAIDFDGNNLIIKNSNFISNSAKSFGGAISLDINGNFNLINSSFSNNYAGDGGALYYRDNFNVPNFDIRGTKFSNNSARYYGGAIYIFSERPHVTISDSEFMNNHARDDALSILSKISIFNSKFLNNHGKKSVFTFKNAVIDNSYFYENYIENDEDSFVMDIRGTSSIIDSKFVKNSKESKYVSLLSEYKISITNDGKTRSFTGIYVFDDNLKAYNYFNFIFKPGKIIYNSGSSLKFKVYEGYTKKTDFFSGFHLKVFTGKKYILYENGIDFVITSKGIVILKDVSKLDVGSHKVEITGPEKRTIGYIKIVKANTIVKSSKLFAKFKKSNYFKVTIKHKTTKKFIKNVKINLKVFDGKKYKIYKLKTNKKGVAKFNTKKLSKGSHKVVVSSGNKNYKISAKSTIKIK